MERWGISLGNLPRGTPGVNLNGWTTSSWLTTAVPHQHGPQCLPLPGPSLGPYKEHWYGHFLDRKEATHMCWWHSHFQTPDLPNAQGQYHTSPLEPWDSPHSLAVVSSIFPILCLREVHNSPSLLLVQAGQSCPHSVYIITIFCVLQQVFHFPFHFKGAVSTCLLKKSWKIQQSRKKSPPTVHSLKHPLTISQVSGQKGHMCTWMKPPKCRHSLLKVCGKESLARWPYIHLCTGTILPLWAKQRSGP